MSQIQREMAAKFNLYTEEKLERRRFSSNEVAQASIRDMLGKY